MTNVFDIVTTDVIEELDEDIDQILLAPAQTTGEPALNLSAGPNPGLLFCYRIHPCCNLNHEKPYLNCPFRKKPPGVV